MRLRELLGPGQPSEWEVSIREAWREVTGGLCLWVGQNIKGGGLERQSEVSGTLTLGWGMWGVGLTLGLKTRAALKLLEQC